MLRDARFSVDFEQDPRKYSTVENRTVGFESRPLFLGRVLKNRRQRPGARENLCDRQTSYGSKRSALLYQCVIFTLRPTNYLIDQLCDPTPVVP